MELPHETRELCAMDLTDWDQDRLWEMKDAIRERTDLIQLELAMPQTWTDKETREPLSETEAARREHGLRRAVVSLTAKTREIVRLLNKVKTRSVFDQTVKDAVFLARFTLRSSTEVDIDLPITEAAKRILDATGAKP